MEDALGFQPSMLHCVQKQGGRRTQLAVPPPPLQRSTLLLLALLNTPLLSPPEDTDPTSPSNDYAAVLFAEPTL